MTHQHNPTRGPGRPRDPAVDERILAAAQRALAADGYARMSIDAIAADAGVTKPTIYRRWPSKADLATAAIAAMQARRPPAATGDTQADLRAQLRHFREGVGRPHAMSLIGSMLVEEGHNPELTALFRERVIATRRRWLREALEAGQARGDIRADLDLEAAVILIVGSYFGLYLGRGEMPCDWDERLMAALWPALAAAPGVTP